MTLTRCLLLMCSNVVLLTCFGCRPMCLMTTRAWRSPTPRCSALIDALASKCDSVIVVSSRYGQIANLPTSSCIVRTLIESSEQQFARVCEALVGAFDESDALGDVFVGSYKLSKAALNACMRRRFSGSSWSVQWCCVCVGWCRTAIGTERATHAPEYGASVLWKLIEMAAHSSLPHAQFVDDKLSLLEW
jgi:hypothetical protein